jgi:hypothetical protein
VTQGHLALESALPLISAVLLRHALLCRATIRTLCVDQVWDALLDETQPGQYILASQIQ